MRRLSRLRKAALVFVAAAVSIAATFVVPQAAAAQVPTPAEDPFYQPPAGYESTAPGTVLRSRESEVALFTQLPIKVKGWQLLYRTTDAQGKAMATVTTVLLPWNAQPDKKRPLLAYQTAEDAVTSSCAPSYGLRKGGGGPNGDTAAEAILIAAAIRQGWAVSVADYEGPDSAYTAGRLAGKSVLDGIRAAEHFAPVGADSTTKVGMWGYSGGALASGWAAELQPSYAPEINLAAVSEGGLVPDLEAAFQQNNKNVFSGVITSSLVGLSRAYPELKDYLDKNLTAEGKAKVQQLTGLCLAGPVIANLFKDTNTYVKGGDPLSSPVVRKVLADNKMGADTTPKAPIFLYHSINDELAPIRPTETYYEQQCSRGAQITFQRDMLSEHVTLAISGAPDALMYLRNHLDGNAAPTGCGNKAVASSLFSPNALPLFGKVLLDSLFAVLGQPQQSPAG